jgi:dipeptidyl aminopeptidase/acylaminoacyl peptidase
MARSVFLLILLLSVAGESLAARPGLTWRDLVQVRKVHSPIISDDGSWIAVEARPDRGDGEVLLRSVDGKMEWSIARGTDPRLSSDGAWAAVTEQASFEARETAEEDDELDSTLLLVELATGAQTRFDDPEEYAFSADGRWFAVRVKAPDAEDEEDGTKAEEPEEVAPPEEEDPEPREAGSPLVLVRLADGEQFAYDAVSRLAWSEIAAWIALVQETEDGLGNRLAVLELGGVAPEESIVDSADSSTWDALAWADELPLFAAVGADTRDPEDPVASRLIEFDASTGAATVRLREAETDEGWTLPVDNALAFSRDGERLFFGLREDQPEEDESEEEEFDILDVESLRDEAGVDVWHWRDPRIKTNERSTFEERSEHRYLAVIHRESGDVVRLAGPDLETVFVPESGMVALGEDSRPWLRERTWDGWFEDVWTVDLRDGSRTKVATRVQDTVSRSPQGGYVVWFADGHFHLHDATNGAERNLTAGLGVTFENEDHDYPRSAPDYGVAGWLRDDSAVVLYDKYDIWLVPSAGGEPLNLTAGRGRSDRRIYRIVDLDDGPEGLDPASGLLLTGFDELAKNSSIWTVGLDGSDLERRREDARYYQVRAKAKDAELYLYSEEAYDVFSDLWIADAEFRRPKRLTDLNPQLEEFDLGEATLVDWVKDDGTPMQGILILPAGYEEGERYPVLVYYYRFFTPRLHRFNDPVINHRPSFYAYAGDGYAVFLPDIRFEVGYPGDSAARSLIPGVQKIIDLGIADPEAIALHGHSWSGYQTAQIITLTDMFACAVAGAPVSNMTSAYGGIRYGTGLSRQFQYEMTQSRLGATLWERRDLYIDNSPLFFADRINTPLLMQFGDEDEAVPWTQGIELYMAMRRLDKPCVFLQYDGEPHHLKKYPNKLDYTLKMKEFIDHFCKGTPAPVWWAEGVPYEGD